MRAATDAEGRRVEVPCHPPDWLVAAVADHRYWPGVPELRYITDCPYITADGSVAEPGFDEATGTLYDPSFDTPALPDVLTRDDARAAAAGVLSIVDQFPFGGDADRDAFLAYLLTIVQRAMIAGPVPGFPFNGNVAGCGKELLVNLGGVVGRGGPVPSRTYPADPAESDKVIMSLALAAVQIVHFDNLPEGGCYGGGPMDAALTSTVWSGRILGESRDSGDVPLRLVWALTGNNISMQGDGDRRWIPINLVTELDNPHEARGHRHQGPARVRPREPRCGRAEPPGHPQGLRPDGVERPRVGLPRLLRGVGPDRPRRRLVRDRARLPGHPAGGPAGQAGAPGQGRLDPGLARDRPRRQRADHR